MHEQARRPAEQPRDALRRAPVLERTHGDAVREGEERPLAAAQHAHDLHLARAGERAGQGQRRADGPAEAPRVGEQEADGTGLRPCGAAAAGDQRERAEDGAVQRDRERAEPPPPAGLAPQDVSAAAVCGR